MKSKKKVFMSLLVAIFLLSSCGKKVIVSNDQSVKIPQEVKIPPRKIDPVPLGYLTQFSLLAYSTINSNSNSMINGKVGLYPGTHDMITLKNTEVLGGQDDILASDDTTVPIDLLQLTKKDLKNAYEYLSNLKPDLDKMDINLKEVKGINFKPGIYSWNGDVSIDGDCTLEGEANSVWVFKISRNLVINKGVHLFIKGKINVNNIFWQVAGHLTLNEGSQMIGTIFTQQFIDFKHQARLQGRGFVKNGFVLMNNATINFN